MKLETYKIINIYGTLTKLIDKEMPFKAALNIATNVKACEPIVKTYEDYINKLRNKYADHDDNGNLIIENNQIKMRQENIEKYINECDEMSLTVVDLVLNKISMSELSDVQVSPRDLVNIEEIFE